MSHEVHHYKLITGIVIGVIALILLGFFFFGRSSEYTTITLEPSTLIRTVTVTGEVVPVDEVTLAFTSGGRVVSLPVVDGQQISRGTTIASLDGAEIQANLRQAIADKAVAEAERNALVGTGNTQGETAATKQQVLATIAKALSTADNQVKTNVDTLFDDPQSGRPSVTSAISNYFVRQTLGQDRVQIGKLLASWSSVVNTLTVDTVDSSSLEETYVNLLTVRTYLSNLSDALSDAEPSNQITNADISNYRALVAAARTAIDTSINDVVAMQDALRSVLAENPVQEARVTSAAASIDRYQALLRNLTLTAPFDGTVAEVLVTQGEIVAANQSIASLVSGDAVELEVFVPEVNIAHLDVDDQAVVTLDAYGESLKLGARVTFIDTRATQKNGIVTYRTKLVFNDVPKAVRPGMTATIAIETVVTPDVLIVPQAAVTVEDATSYVDVLVGKESVRREVVLGMADTRGGVLVESGLEVGDVVITGK